MSMKITAKMLINSGACPKGVAEATEVFPALAKGGVRVTLANLKRARKAWLDAASYLKPLIPEQRRAEYTKVRCAAWAEYEKVRDAALAEYDKASYAAWAGYEKVRDAAWAEYENVRCAALVEAFK